MRTGRAPVLAGCRILLTAGRRARDLGEALQERGAEVVHAPTLELVRHRPAELLAATRCLLADPPDVVVVTTGTGVRTWVEVADEAGLGEDLRAVLRRARVAARGPKSRAALEDAGVVPDWLAEAESSAAVLDFLVAEGLAGRRVALLHAGARADDVERRLLAAGAELRPLQSYRWVRRDRHRDVRQSAVDAGAGRFDAVVLTCAPGAQAWLDAVRRAGVAEVLRERVEAHQLLLVAPGAATARPLAYAGLLAAVPGTARLGDLVRLLLDELGDDRHALVTGHGLLRVRAASVTLDHEPVPLSPAGLALLRRLAATPGHVVSREELVRVLPGASQDPRRAEVAVARLREALRTATGDGALVRTVVRRGYVLAAR